MNLPLTRETLPFVHWFESAESTNTLLRDLVAEAGEGVEHGTLVVTANQTAGRGRQGRVWEAPPNTALAASLLVRPGVPVAANALGLSWLPLLAGSAVVRALQPLFSGERGLDETHGGHQSDAARVRQQPKRVGVKWPNDVHVRDEEDALVGRPGAKLSGILCEVLPSGEVVVGFGINLLLEEWQLPTERAGSVLACGGDVGGAKTLADPLGEALADRVLAAASSELLTLVERAALHPKAARTRVLRDSLTLGTEVRVHLPNGEVVDGRAVGLDDDGALIVDRPTTGQLIVNAADIEHLR